MTHPRSVVARAAKRGARWARIVGPGELSQPAVSAGAFSTSDVQAMGNHGRSERRACRYARCASRDHEDQANTHLRFNGISPARNWL